jgi:phosphate transport system protein
MTITMTTHIVTSFSDELENLSASLMEMGGLAEAMIRDACRAVTVQDHSLARHVIQRNLDMQQMQSDCERNVVRLLALRQPMASDLRMVIGAIKLAGTIERIGNLSKNIANRSLAIDETDHRGALRGIGRMGQAVSRQLQTALDAYSCRDARAAVAVVDQDDDIDSHYNALLRAMLVYMMEDPEQLDARSNLLFIVKNLERIGDHCTGIARVVHFIVTGDQLTTPTETARRQATLGQEG